MAIQAYRSNAASIASFPEVQRAEQALNSLETTAEQIQHLIAANTSLSSGPQDDFQPVRPLLDFADIGISERTNAQVQAFANQGTSRESLYSTAILLESSDQERTSSYRELSLPSNVTKGYAYQRIPLCMSGIPKHLLPFVEAVWGNAPLPLARNVLIADTAHSDTVQGTNHVEFVTECIKDGDVLLHEGTPRGREEPPESSYFYNIHERNKRGITEAGWDDIEFSNICTNHVKLLDTCIAKVEERDACSKKLHPEDGALTPEGAEKFALEEQYKALHREAVDLNAKVESGQELFDIGCSVRDGSLDNALKSYYKAGRRVWAVAGAWHISPELLAKIAMRRVIVIILKGKPLDQSTDKKADHKSN